MNEVLFLFCYSLNYLVIEMTGFEVLTDVLFYVVVLVEIMRSLDIVVNFEYYI